ncbi:hypothetical protein CRU87_09365 [Aliarcobacter trophiarum LMG 25534]|uniref:Uncharacterized protein n=1 Tax=Aliarcobacter trophiarum LMG 25534 TaxID=1032241 RepID=A0AAD0QIB5_9BACT|nr:hypothetical protein [Aliarcobacter trophiarum]AXK48504.1 hypothetical protein ATR_0635 [Aliarcobacter trophiarum LMG 25534]RXI27598.1 hypothetical protein CRU89_04795 [Aliarcobacter trophiarum]RXJ89349.1 hypothetical protein CRU87_09365 [Aliarcobacter trophiarum LMG 25534]
MNKNILMLVLVAIFFVVGFFGFKSSLPEDKNKRVYSILEEFLPYTIEKRTGGLAIVYKDGREKEKPKNSEIFHITDRLDKEWGKESLRVDGNTLIILDKDKQELKRVELDTKELSWVKEFFGI